MKPTQQAPEDKNLQPMNPKPLVIFPCGSLSADDPIAIGTKIEYEDGDTGEITKEDGDHWYIESSFFTGWVKKETFQKYLEE